MEKRFRALRVIATIYKIVAWIVLICGVLFALIFFVTAVLSGASGSGRDLSGVILAGGLGGGVVAMIALLYAAVLFLVLYGAGEVIFLGLAIEENTRESALLMRNLPRVT